MGWKKYRYELNQRRLRDKSNTPKLFTSLPPDGLTRRQGVYIFRPHVFEQYRKRVFEDPVRLERSDEGIIEIITHSLSHSDMPQRISLYENFNVLTNIHEHSRNGTRDYGLFYIPIKRDKNNINQKGLCIMTILSAQEKFEKIRKRF